MDKFTKKLKVMGKTNSFQTSKKKAKKIIKKLELSMWVMFLQYPIGLMLTNIFMSPEQMSEYSSSLLMLIISPIIIAGVIFIITVKENNLDVDLAAYGFLLPIIMRKQLKAINYFNSAEEVERYYKSLIILEEHNIDLNKENIINFEKKLDNYLKLEEKKQKDFENKYIKQD